MSIYLLYMYHMYRYVKENHLFAGLWYGSVKPDMTVFLEPIAKEFSRLSVEG